MSTALVNSSHSAKKQSLRRYDMRGIMKKTSFITSGPNLNHTLWWQLFQAGYWFSEPLSDSLLPPPLLRPLPKYKGISDPPSAPPESVYSVWQSTKTEGRLPAKKRPPCSIAPHYEGLLWPRTPCPCHPFGCTNSGDRSSSFPFETLRFQGYFWSSNALKSMCKYRGHCQAKKKVRHTSPRPNCFGHDHDSQFHFQMLPEPSQKSFGDD